jgi:WXXGXW repeat (2 copies)
VIGEDGRLLAPGWKREATMTRTFFPWVFGLLIAITSPTFSISQEPVADPKSNPIEVQTRGPLHDAIAQPFGVKPEPGPLVAKEPPAPIPEDPPQQKPDMANVQWVPGYWAWDAVQQEFMWVSGVYRVPPQDRSYIPGYWASGADGWRWVPGFWSQGKLQNTTYAPEPPAPLDNGPALQAPNDNSLYVPGTWDWQRDRFVWRPGYWAAAQNGRVWIPPHYLWTPNGYAFVDGYWDYPLEDRGMIFAPVTFNRPLWNDPNWIFTPNHIVSPNSFLDSAFIYGPSFFFGNFYNRRHAQAGFNPWHTGRGRYDPTFAYHGWKNPGWLAGVQQTYAGRASGRLNGPPLTFAQQGNANFVTPLNQFAGTQMVKSTSAQLATQRTGIQQTRQLAVTRQQLESAGAGKANGGNAIRLTAGSNSSSAPRIINGGTTNAGGAMPKIVNEPRTFAPANSAPRIVNSPSVTPPRTITPSAAPKIATPTPRVTPPARTFNPAPARGASIARPAAGRKR